MSFPVNIKILYQAFIHSINLKKAGVGQPKYCNNAYVHVVLTNLCRYFLFLSISIISIFTFIIIRDKYHSLCRVIDRIVVRVLQKCFNKIYYY